jgi:hypothetical protein
VFRKRSVARDASAQRGILWTNEQTGLNGARADVAQRAALQGKESPAGGREGTFKVLPTFRPAMSQLGRMPA